MAGLAERVVRSAYRQVPRAGRCALRGPEARRACKRFVASGTECGTEVSAACDKETLRDTTGRPPSTTGHSPCPIGTRTVYHGTLSCTTGTPTMYHRDIDRVPLGHPPCTTGTPTVYQ